MKANGGFRERSKTDERLTDVARPREDDKRTNSKRNRKDKEKEREATRISRRRILKVICARLDGGREKGGSFRGIGKAHNLSARRKVSSAKQNGCLREVGGHESHHMLPDSQSLFMAIWGDNYW